MANYYTTRHGLRNIPPSYKRSGAARNLEQDDSGIHGRFLQIIVQAGEFRALAKSEIQIRSVVHGQAIEFRQPENGVVRDGIGEMNVEIGQRIQKTFSISPGDPASAKTDQNALRTS